MSELRWILALLGALFVVGVFLWERRKQRPGARGTGSMEPAPGDEAIDWNADRVGEAPLTLPEIRAREPVQPLPVIELPHDDVRFDADSEPSGAAAPGGAFGAAVATEADDLDANGHVAAADLAHDTGDFHRARNGHAGEARAPATRIEPSWDDAADIARDDAGTERGAGSRRATPPLEAPSAADTGAVPETVPAPIASAGIPVVRAARIEPLPRADPAALRLEWAAEPERRIIAIRVVPIIDRFGGRTVRQALAGEGFLHGPLAIFHRALPDGRVVSSCASLTKPGSFDLATMDSQRFAGLNLFAVLPGPLSAAETLEDLVAVARTLSARLAGLVQDERGQPLDAARLAELREMAAARGALPTRPPTAPAGAGENASP